ncbi:MAG: T9SS type A sorting domain-containing protein [Saprospiraceae bacterium]
MNKLTLLLFALFTTLPLIHLQAQTGLQITSTCQSDSLYLPANECVAIDHFFSISATTDCSTSSIVEYNFSIDWNDDGVIDSLGSAASFTADFPIGSHRVKFTAFDFCGGEENCEFQFLVKDTIAPQIYPDSNSLIIYPSEYGDYYLSASIFYYLNPLDSCSSSENIQLSFSENPLDTLMIIDCNQIFSTCGYLDIPIFATDKSNNQDSCIQPIQINNYDYFICGVFIDVFPIPLSTLAETMSYEQISQTNYLIDTTHVSTFSSIPSSCLLGFHSPHGDTLRPFHHTNPLNGVTTFDIVLMRKHILVIDLFDNEYSKIAADVNKSGTITTLDIVLTRKMILQSSDEFPSGESWVFQPEFILIDTIEYNDKFIGIKLGDVNDTANPNGIQNNQTDTRIFDGTLNLSTQDQIFKTGETVTITTFANNFDKIIGGQFTIDFDPTALAFQSIEGNNSIELNEDNFGKNHTDDGFILCSWNTAVAQNLESQNDFFEITFTAKKNGQLSDFITINSKKLVTEIYVENENEIEFWNTELSFENENIQDDFSFAPNPFAERTIFNFSLENAGQVELEIFDTNGRLVFSQQKNMLAGENQIEILKANFPNNGIYFYKIKGNSQIHSGKLLLL